MLFRSLKIPIKISEKKNYDYIKISGPCNFQGFEYKIPGDISSSSFFIVLTLLAKKSKLVLKNININNSRIGIIKLCLKIKKNTKVS